MNENASSSVEYPRPDISKTRPIRPHPRLGPDTATYEIARNQFHKSGIAYGYGQQPYLYGAIEKAAPWEPAPNFVVVDGNRMKVAKENAKNIAAMTGPHLAAQTLYRRPVSDRGVEKFVKLLGDTEDLVASWNGAIMSIMYTGSFGAAADLNGRELPNICQQIPALRTLKFSSEVCEKVYSTFIDLVAEELSSHARDIIKNIRVDDVNRVLGCKGANVVLGSVDMLRRVQTAFESVEPGPTAIDDVEDRFAKDFQGGGGRGGGGTTKQNEKRVAAVTRLSDFAQFFKQFPKALLTQDLIDRIKKAPLYRKIMHIPEIEQAFQLIASAANRAMIQLSKSTRIPNVDYRGINTDIIHFWLASLRYEQNRWLKGAYPNLNNERLESAAASDIMSSNHEPLRDKRLGRKIDPPISYARVRPMDGWNRSRDPEILQDLPYFHLFKGLPLQQLSAKDALEISSRESKGRWWD